MYNVRIACKAYRTLRAELATAHDELALHAPPRLYRRELQHYKFTDDDFEICVICQLDEPVPLEQVGAGVSLRWGKPVERTNAAGAADAAADA